MSERILVVISTAKDGTVYRNTYQSYHDWANKINQDIEAGYAVEWYSEEMIEGEREREAARDE